MLRYAITEGRLDEVGEDALVLKCGAVRADYLLVREKAVEAGRLVEVCRRVRAVTRARVLVSGRADVALAAGIAGVHLSSGVGELTVGQVRRVMAGAVLSVSCHTVAECGRARQAGADLILFGPVFEKAGVMDGVGLERLREACVGGRVLALGGVGEGTVGECLGVGAVGYAGIRAFFG